MTLNQLLVSVLSLVLLFVMLVNSCVQQFLVSESKVSPSSRFNVLFA